MTRTQILTRAMLSPLGLAIAPRLLRLSRGQRAVRVAREELADVTPHMAAAYKETVRVLPLVSPDMAEQKAARIKTVINEMMIVNGHGNLWVMAGMHCSYGLSFTLPMIRVTSHFASGFGNFRVGEFQHGGHVIPMYEAEEVPNGSVLIGHDPVFSLPNQRVLPMRHYTLITFERDSNADYPLTVRARG